MAAPVAAAPAAVPAQPLLATFSISNENGVIQYSGVVRDEATRQSIINELKAVYGADAIKGDIAVDDHRASAPWLDKLHAALENLKVPGLQALFSGASIHLGGLVDDLEGTYLYKYLSGLFGSDWKIGALSDHFGDVVTTANKTAAASLASLKPGFSADDLIVVLNLSILNFPTASAEIGPDERALLQSAAARIKMLPADTVIEIDGYTDNSGGDDVNIPLSQRRADAVHKALVDAGVAPAALVAKGFGSANPVGSNDSVEGRFRNRRIEYRVGK
jgi:OOP family OmpA-OmpF porin